MPQATNWHGFCRGAPVTNDPMISSELARRRSCCGGRHKHCCRGLFPIHFYVSTYALVTMLTQQPVWSMLEKEVALRIPLSRSIGLRLVGPGNHHSILSESIRVTLSLIKAEWYPGCCPWMSCFRVLLAQDELRNKLESTCSLEVSFILCFRAANRLSGPLTPSQLQQQGRLPV